MKVVDFAQILRESINEKINECRSDIHQSHRRIDADKFMIQIQALEWVQGRVQDLVINTERKEKIEHTDTES
jgi:hypothetical protein